MSEILKLYLSYLRASLLAMVAATITFAAYAYLRGPAGVGRQSLVLFLFFAAVILYLVDAHILFSRFMGLVKRDQSADRGNETVDGFIKGSSSEAKVIYEKAPHTSSYRKKRFSKSVEGGHISNQPSSVKPQSSLWLLRLTRISQVALDSVIMGIAFVLTYMIRFDFAVPEEQIWRMLYQLPFVVLLQWSLLWITGVYTFIWRYVGVSEIRAFVSAAFWSALPMVILRLALPDRFQFARIPLSIIVIDCMLAIAGVLSLRILRRTIYERSAKRQSISSIRQSYPKRPILLIGAGRAGVLAAKEIKTHEEMGLEVKGFVDDDRTKLGSVIHGIRVLGNTDDIPRLVSQLKIDHVVISMAQVSRREFRRILDLCERVPVRVRTIPNLFEVLQGKSRIAIIRDPEIEDLLARDSVTLDNEGISNFIAGKTVMVTGAGGSIGSGLARQIARFAPSTLLLVDRSEVALFAVERELSENWPSLSLVSLLVDVGQEPAMRSVFSNFRPQVVFHAAAHKVVRMLEFSPSAAVQNNVLATHLLGTLAMEFGVELFVLISTDKAFRPTSVMGASKRVAELVIQDLNQRSKTHFVGVRFGNVIGAAGSVIPIFREQIRRGGPVTITHPEMTRYFMTIPEAAQLVLQAGALAEGGEVFVLDMGEPVRILDLARDTITLSGLKPYADIDIVFTGVRAGEKLLEELPSADLTQKTGHPKILIDKTPGRSIDLSQVVERLKRLTMPGRERELISYLNMITEGQLQSAIQAVDRLDYISKEGREQELRVLVDDLFQVA